jgi:hypothetical protein
VTLVGEELDGARDIDLLNAPPPEHPLFLDVVGTLTEMLKTPREIETEARLEGFACVFLTQLIPSDTYPLRRDTRSWYTRRSYPVCADEGQQHECVARCALARSGSRPFRLVRITSSSFLR